jgi:hypothetical protein
MALPIFKDNNTPFQLMQSNWSSQLNPVLSNRMTNPTLLYNIDLVSGTNVINHKLGATPVGWFLTDITAPVTVYRSAAFNNLTLTLYSSGPATISLGVF